MSDAASQLVLGSLESTSLTASEKAFLLEESPPGLTLFGRNISSFDQLKQLNTTLKNLAGSQSTPFLIAIDQEGGRVARLKDSFPNLGPAMSLFDGKDDTKSLAALEDYGRQVGSRLNELGVNINFAPVLDVLTEPKNDCIGDRSFSSDPVKASRRAAAYLKGLEAFGSVMGCLKHFPGQGHGIFDTHERPCEINKTLEELSQCEFVPFMSMLKDARIVMTSHCVYPVLSEKPASLSFEICTTLLREQMGYRGVLVSDDLTMSAISQDLQSWKEAVVQSIAAGCDSVLVCKDLDKWRMAIEAIRQKAKTSFAFQQQIEMKADRMVGLRKSLNTSKQRSSTSQVHSARL